MQTESNLTPQQLTPTQLAVLEEMSKFAVNLLRSSFCVNDPLYTIELDVMQGTDEIYRQSLAQVLNVSWVITIPDAPSTKLYAQPRIFR